MRNAEVVIVVWQTVGSTDIFCTGLYSSEHQATKHIRDIDRLYLV